MKANGFKIIVRINKELQKAKREKLSTVITDSGEEITLFAADHLMNFRRNLQFGEILSFGDKVPYICPEIEVGAVAIFHHYVEFKTINKNREEGNETPDPEDTHLIEIEENGDEIRFLTASDDLGCELFGVFKNKTIYPSRNVIFCKPQVRQSGFQMVKGIYINNDTDIQNIKDSIDLVKHSIDEFTRVLTNVRENEKTHRIREGAMSEITRLQKVQSDLKAKLDRITLGEMEVMYIPSTDNIQNIAPGDMVLSNIKHIYPLDLFGKEFALIRDFKIIYGKSINGVPTPINDRVIIKQDSPKDVTESGLIIPDTAKKKPMSGTVLSVGESYDYPMPMKAGDHVIFHPLGMVEIFIEDEPYVFLHSQSVMAKTGYCPL